MFGNVFWFDDENGFALLHVKPKKKKKFNFYMWMRKRDDITNNIMICMNDFCNGPASRNWKRWNLQKIVANYNLLSMTRRLFFFYLFIWASTHFSFLCMLHILLETIVNSKLNIVIKHLSCFSISRWKSLYWKRIVCDAMAIFSCFFFFVNSFIFWESK